MIIVKNLLKSLTAFSLGNTMLLLSYILVYAIDGSYRFTLEISKLTEFEYLLGQVAFSGIIYVVIFLAINTFADFASKEKGRIKWKDLAKFVVSYVALLAVVIIIQLIDRRGILNDYIGGIFIGISVIGCVVAATAYIIYNSVQKNKINKALKEKQRDKK